MVACSTSYALDEQFNDALRAANAGDLASLEQYQIAMQNDDLNITLNIGNWTNNLAFQAPSSIVSFAQRLPYVRRWRKNSRQLCWRKVKLASFADAKPLLGYVNNADKAESCALAQVRAKTGDNLVFAEYKDIWLATDSQPDSCHGLGRLMLSNPVDDCARSSTPCLKHSCVGSWVLP